MLVSRGDSTADCLPGTMVLVCVHRLVCFTLHRPRFSDGVKLMFLCIEIFCRTRLSEQDQNRQKTIQMKRCVTEWPPLFPFYSQDEHRAIYEQ